MKKTTLAEVGETLAFIVENMATKEDVQKLEARTGRLEETSKESNERLRSLEKGQDKILEELKPLSKAHDKDAETIVDHGRRIMRIEKRVSV